MKWWEVYWGHNARVIVDEEERRTIERCDPHQWYTGVDLFGNEFKIAVDLITGYLQCSTEANKKYNEMAYPDDPETGWTPQ